MDAYAEFSVKRIGNTKENQDLIETHFHPTGAPSLFLHMAPKRNIALWKGGLPVNEVDRDLGLVLLKRLRQRDLISEETFVSADNSRFFDRKRFTLHAGTDNPTLNKENHTDDDD